MKAFTGLDNGENLYGFGVLNPIDPDSQFSSLPPSSIPILSSVFPADLIEKIRTLKIRPTEELEFVDFDNTLLDDERRFDICPELRGYRGKSAYPYIRQKFGKNGSNGFREFVELLNPSQHLLDYSDFYDPENPNNIILTAGDTELQTLKVEAAFGKETKKIIVEDARDKPLAMLKYILELGYIPGRISFKDDKIDDFLGMDRKLANILGNTVRFYRAIPNSADRSVTIESVKLLQHFTRAQATQLLRA